MTRNARRTAVSRLALVALTLAVVIAPAAVAPSPAAAASWAGGVDLYRPGVFTTQKSWLWCTAADVQIMRNIVRHESDHSRASQERYFGYMRAHNRYRIRVRDGVDPAGWTAGLRHYVDGRYRMVASRSFDAALRSAVTNLRRTNLPVGITVSHGNHAWVLTGFTATRDPAVTNEFTVTGVRVVGPLWGLQSRAYGYDMRPDRRLTPRQLRGFFTPWHYTSVPMAWENRWVSVQPIPSATTGSSTTPKAVPKPTTPAAPSASLESMSPVISSPAANASPVVATAVAGANPALAPAARDVDAEVTAATAPFLAVLAIAVALALLVLVLGVRAARRPSQRGSR